MQQSHKLVRLISSLDTIHLSLLENLLVQEGIAVERRNFVLAGGIGELPFVDVMPELWVAESDHEHATKVLDEFRQADSDSAEGSRTCPQCGEPVERQFVQCWKCGHMFKD